MKRSVEGERSRGVESLVRSALAVLCVSALTLIGAFSVGCVTTPEGIPLVEGRELGDIPVKNKFKFIGSETYDPPVAEAGKFRSWRGLYRGPGLQEDIGPWYVGAMKRHGWQFTGAVQSKGRAYIYNFVKGDEEAVIQVYREYSFALGKSTNMVRAEVHPRGTETFLLEHIETLKTTGDNWTLHEPTGISQRETGMSQETVRPVSFSGNQTTENPSSAATSEFLRDGPAGEKEAPAEKEDVSENDTEETP